MLNGTLKPYIAYSAAAHAAGVVALAMLGVGSTVRPEPVYTISFVGATPGIVNRTPAARRKAAPTKAAPQTSALRRPPPQTDPDAFNLKKRKGPLPKLKFIPGAPIAPKPEAKPVVAEPSPEPAAEVLEDEPAAGEDAAPAEPGGASLVAPEMPDFPYPWYVTRIRSSLWENWSERFSSGSGECGVRFTILKDGSVVDLRVEFTSGDKAFDYAAITAIENSKPFPPLPPGYGKPFLNIHFEFRSR